MSGPVFSGFELPDITANRDAVVKNFVDEAKRLIQLGAEVIIPSAGPMVPPGA